nr:efflux transporter outer membrane subunit [Deltaproteobacteria bacterium]
MGKEQDILIWRTRLTVSVFVATLACAGCAAVGPDYVPPETAVPEAWHTHLPPGLFAEEGCKETLTRWWSTLSDPVLEDLIETAVMENLDVKEARARVREARARRGISKADLFPAVDAGGSVRLSRSSEETGSGGERKLYAVDFDAAWELDIFGGRRRALEAAEADLHASEEDLRDVLVSLLAEVALNYIEVRSFQTRLSIAMASLDTQQETFNITQWRVEAGLTTQLDLEQATYNLAQTQSKIPGFEIGLEQAKNRLAVLLAKPPGFLEDILDKPQAIPVAPLEIAFRVPAEVLRRRPDIRRAERNLAAYSALVGVATAELYPKFSLLGSIGLEALSSDSLFSAGSRTHSIGPSITWSLFDAGAIRNNIEVQSALQEQAFIQYEATVLTAFEEVENALIAYAEEQNRRESLDLACRAARKAVDLAQNQYVSGLIDFNTLLDAQRSLLSFQDQLAVSEGDAIANLITLYKVLGGGWSSFEPERKNRAVPGRKS